MTLILHKDYSKTLFSVMLINFCFLCFLPQLKSQTDFYDNNYVREVRLYFNQPDWDHILDSLFVNGQEERLLASVTIDGVHLDSVGVRYKGYSSVDTATIKNPLNIFDVPQSDWQEKGLKPLEDLCD